MVSFVGNVRRVAATQTRSVLVKFVTTPRLNQSDKSLNVQNGNNKCTGYDQNDTDYGSLNAQNNVSTRTTYDQSNTYNRYLIEK